MLRSPLVGQHSFPAFCGQTSQQYEVPPRFETVSSAFWKSMSVQTCVP